MKFLIISDTHRIIENAIEIIQKTKPDYVLHLGDVCDDCERLQRIFPNKIILSVIGNNDFARVYPEFPAERVFTINNKKFFMCHGHKYNVKYGLERLMFRAMELNADIVLYGHTHSAHLENTSKMIIMNPGSIKSYGIIEIDGDNTKARLEKYE